MSSVTVPPAQAFGVSGDTSTNALNRLGSLTVDDLAMFATATPDVAIVYIGVNDPVNNIAQAVTQLNVQCMLLALKHGAYGEPHVSGGAYVAGQASLPLTGRPGQRYVVVSDTSTTGGLAAEGGGQATTVTGTVASSGPAVWEFRRARVGEDGWGRVAVSVTTPTACKRIVVLSTNYKNFFNDGSGSLNSNSAGRRDTTSTPEPWYAQVRAAQQAAVTAENAAVGGKASVVYADLYTLQRTMIVGGTFPASGSPTLSRTYSAGYVPDFSGGATYDGTKDWHYTSSNQHHGRFGHWTVALAAFLSVVNAAWAPDLAALVAVNVKALGDSQTDYHADYTRPLFTWAPVLSRMLQDYLATV